MKYFFTLNILILISFKINKAEICDTKECKDAALLIQEYLDENVEPCNDFFEFTCGKFMNKTRVPEGKDRVNAFSIIENKFRDQIKNSIEEKSNFTDQEPFKTIKTVYGSCMNKTRIEKRGKEPLKILLENLGGWPVVDGDKWVEKDFSWIKSMRNFRRAGISVNYLISLNIVVDPRNETRNIIHFSPGDLYNLRDLYLLEGINQKFIKEYHNFMVDIADYMGADKTNASIDLMKSLEFEIKLANISVDEKKRYNPTDTDDLMTVRILSKLCPSIPWLEYINSILTVSPNITEDEPIIYDPRFMVEFEKLLKRTPKTVQANYLMWRAAKSSIKFISDKFRLRELAYNNAISGEKIKIEPRWKECVNLVSRWFPLSISALYVEKYFKHDHWSANKNLDEMVTKIKREFKKTLQEVEWMDETTRKTALEKVDSVKARVAYPEELLNMTRIKQLNNKLETNSEYYFESMLNISFHHNETYYSKLRKPPINQSSWKKSGKAATVKAHYYFTENTIDFSAGALQDIIFGYGRPNYMNYATLGSIIGREIAHGFDSRGSQYNKDGKLINWWQPETKENYRNLTKCIISQYKDSTLFQKAYLDDNVAYIGGLKVAYKAYENWALCNGPESKLPGLTKYTPQQMFWISAATAMCAKYDEGTDSQSFARFHVLASITNIKQFSKDFECKNFSENLEEKCYIW